MKALIATRFSDQKQIGNTSTEVQKEGCEDFCEREGHEIIGRHIVEAESAKATNISRIADLLDFCKKYEGRAQILVVFKVDRFMRDISSHYYLKTELLKMGISLRSATEPIGSDPQGELLEGILASFAQFDNAIKRERVRLAMKNLLERGIWPFKCPLGYINKTNSLNKATIPDIDSTCDFSVKYIFEKFATGTITQTELSKDPILQNVLNYKGEKVSFSPQYINKILRNTFYIGILQVPQWDMEYTGAHTSLVTQDVFYKCQKVLGVGEKDIERLSMNPTFPLRDRLFCEYCGGKMTAAVCKGKCKNYLLYYCHNSNCPNKHEKSINKTDFEAEFFQYLETIKPDENDFKDFSEIIIKRYEQRKTEFETRSSSIRKQLDVYEQEKANLINMGKKGVLDAEEAKVEMDTLKKNIAKLKLSLNEAHEEEFRIEMLLEYARTFFRTLGLFWLDASPATKVRLQRILFPIGIIYSFPGFSNTTLAPGFKVVEDVVVASKTLVTPRRIELRLPG